MNKLEAQARITKLRQELNKHNYLYYVKAQPEISDQQYDLLYKELEELEANFPDMITAESPTQRVGGQPTKKFKHVRHSLPMLSLDNVFFMEAPPATNKRDLRKFDNSIRKKLFNETIEYVLEPKIDGVSINLRYENGRLTVGATRGDGTTGDDITANIRTIHAIPLKLNTAAPPSILEVRGEIFMNRSDFHAMNTRLQQAGEETFENARNATAGSLKLLDPRLVATRPLDARFYTVGASEGIDFSTQLEVLKKLALFGLPVQKHCWRCMTIEEIFEKAASLEGLKEEIPYEIDGAVIKVNNLNQCRRLGETAKSPRYSVAYKFLEDSPENRAETKLLAITVQVGRTGTLTPVAEIEPTSLAGSTIARVTLHNEDEIKRKDIRIGDTLIIKKAGMVIPAVIKSVKEKRLKESKPFDFFAHLCGQCPECRGPIHRDPEFSAWRCENLQCPAQNARRIIHFASRKAMNIEGLGDIVAEKLVEKNIAREPLDLFGLTQERLANLNLGTEKTPRIFGEKNAEKIINAVEKAKALPLSRWLYAFGIPKVGKTIAYQVAHAHQNLEDVGNSQILKDVRSLLEKQEEAKIENQNAAKGGPNIEKENRFERVIQLNEEVEQIGRRLESKGIAKKKVMEKKKRGPQLTEYTTEFKPEATKSLISFFSSEPGIGILKRLRRLGISPKERTMNKSDQTTLPLREKAFVLTGTLSAMTREEAAEKIREKGGDVSTAVSKNTSFLIIGSNPGANKLKQAQKCDVPTIDENELLQMLGRQESKILYNNPKQEELF